jgi:hypothetical protein
LADWCDGYGGRLVLPTLPLTNDAGEREEMGIEKEKEKKVVVGSQVQTAADIELNGMLEPRARR